MLTIILCSWKSIECPSDCDSARSAVALQCVREDLETKDTTIMDHSYCSNLSRPNDLECSSACLAFSAWSEVSKSIRILPKRLLRNGTSYRIFSVAVGKRISTEQWNVCRVRSTVSQSTISTASRWISIR